MLPTLDSSGLKSINSVSSMTFVVSTSSTSLLRQLIRFLRAPDATEAGYTFAKLLNPNIAALRSSSNVALCRRPLSVEIVLVAFCFAGACDSSSLNIILRLEHSPPRYSCESDTHNPSAIGLHNFSAENTNVLHFSRAIHHGPLHRY